MGHIPSIIPLGYPRRRTMHVTKLIRNVFDHQLGDASEVYLVEEYLGILCQEGDVNRRWLEDLTECKVVKLELRKCPNSWAHEFVLAFVEHTSIDNTTQQEVTQSRVFMIERESNPQIIGQLGGSNAIGSPETKFADETLAVDRLQIYESLAGVLKVMYGELCYTVQFIADNTQPNILDLAAATCALNRFAPNYTLFKHMCFWYANNLCRVLAQGRNYNVIEKNKHAGLWNNTMLIDHLGKMILESTLPEFCDVTPAALEEMANEESSLFSLPSSASTDPALGISTHHFVHSDPVVVYHVKYKACLADAESMIRVEKRNERLATAKRRADEQRQRADEQWQRADEERRRADEERRRADEERRRADEERRRADEERQQREMAERRADEERRQREMAERRIQELERQLAEAKKGKQTHDTT
ncbi:hypothetical protein QCA50_004129 [Cerrena zonata]|uniref:Uncharacterized protein n=1 Tax=Cerrena zonata TaxID=2478898 RepID=A0AAW0GR96_9APHY